MFPRPDFFKGTEFNFARNLLYPVLPAGTQPIQENDIAIISATESKHQQMTWGELRREVRKCANALRPYLRVGDRVAGFLGNHSLTVVAMLATTSLGALWTAVSPDTGVAAVLDRLVQIEPKILFADNGVEYNGKVHESMTKVKEITKALQTLQAVVVFKSMTGVDTSIGQEDLPLSCKEFTYGEFATVDEFKR
jgi:acetoacetyl-CoA synthetase